jgi:formylglycine-generating enzyme required for sulfatase activity
MAAAEEAAAQPHDCAAASAEWESLGKSKDRIELTRFYASLGTDCREIGDAALARLESVPAIGSRLVAAGKPQMVAPATLAKDGAVFRDCDRCPELTVVPGGTFLMGPREGEGNSFDGEKQKKATVARMAVGRYEVTFEQHDACAVAGKCGKLFLYDYGDGRQQRPVNVRYHEAQAYVTWLSQHTGHRYRLLTEAEWEHAARGGTATRWYWGDNPEEGCAYENLSDLAFQATPGRLKFESGFVANCNDGLGDSTAPVGSYRPNPFGLYDMLGNRAEWVKSCQAGTDKTSPDRCHSHIARAGSYRTGPLLSAVTRRDAWGWNERAGTIRVARELD